MGVFPQVYLFFCCFLKVIPRYHTSLCQTRRPLSSIQQHLGTCLSLLSLSGCSGSVSGMHRAVLAKVCRMLKANCSVQVWNTHKWVFPHSLRAEPAPPEAPGSGVLVLLWAPALLLTGTEPWQGVECGQGCIHLPTHPLPGASQTLRLGFSSIRSTYCPVNCMHTLCRWLKNIRSPS